MAYSVVQILFSIFATTVIQLNAGYETACEIQDFIFGWVVLLHLGMNCSPLTSKCSCEPGSTRKRRDSYRGSWGKRAFPVGIWAPGISDILWPAVTLDDLTDSYSRFSEETATWPASQHLGIWFLFKDFKGNCNLLLQLCISHIVRPAITHNPIPIQGFQRTFWASAY